jgi:hypothetical protein
LGAVLAMRLSEGLALYPDPDSLIVNNYPPLWYALLALAHVNGIDAVVFGRIVAFLSQVGAAILVARIVADLSQEMRFPVAWLAGGFFLMATSAWLPTYVATSDPQWLSLALMLLGLRYAVCAQSSAAASFAALWIVLGGFVKHSGLALPLAALVWLWSRNRRLGCVFLFALCGFALFGFVVCALLFGADFFRGVFLHARAIDIRLPYWNLLLNPGFFVFAALALIWLWMRPQTFAIGRFARIYLAVALVFGTLFSVGVGTAGNLYFDTWVALAFAVAAFVVTAARSRREEKVSRSFAVISTLALSHVVIAGFLSAKERLTDDAQMRQANYAAAIDIVRHWPGPVACENAVVCYWGARESALDFFNIGQRVATGRWSAADVAARLKAAGVGLLQVERIEARGWSERFPPDLSNALSAYYRVNAELTSRVASAMSFATRTEARVE